MKNIYWVLAVAATIIISSCKKDVDSLKGKWNIEEFTGETETTSINDSVIFDIKINHWMQGGNGTLDFRSNNTLKGEGVLYLGVKIENPFFPLELDGSLDVNETFTGSNYEKLSDNQVIIEIDNEDVVFNYEFSKKTVVLTGIRKQVEHDFDAEPSDLKLTIMLSK